ncbi:PHP domain-containing protein [bacterium]|nr:PHP domain-containing protein [bacterium]
MGIIADLHCHSTASDGVDRPARVVERAKAAGLKVLALTDHDSVDGVPEARAKGNELGVEVLTGAELTCYIGKQELNVLAYGIDENSPALVDHCTKFVQARTDRARKIGERLAECGAPLDMDAVVASCDGGVVGRPHIAKALVAAGHVESYQQAFDLYLANGKPGDVPKMMVDPQFIIDVIHEANGLAVLAHPGLWDQFDMLPDLKKMGMDGVEVWHSCHSQADSLRLLDIADRYGLMKTGGSDCHGALGDRKEILGQWGLDTSAWLRVKERLDAR